MTELLLNESSDDNIDDVMSEANEQIEQEQKNPEFSCEICNCFTSTNPGAYATHKKHCEKKLLNQNKAKASNKDIRNMFAMAANKNSKSNTSNHNKSEQDINEESEQDINGQPSEQDINGQASEQEINSQNPGKPIKLKCRKVLVDENNNIIEFIDTDETVDVPACMGAIPDALKSVVSEGSSILKHLPLDSIDELQHKQFLIGEYGIHHKSCKGFITQSKNGTINDRCCKFTNNTFLNDLINDSIYSGNIRQKNCKMNYQALQKKLEERAKLINTLRAQIQTRDRQILNSTVRIEIYKRINTSLALDNGASMVRLWRSYIKSGKSEKFLFSKITLFLNGQYSPKSYNHDDYYRAALVLLMGNALLLNTLFNSGLFMCSKTTYNKLKDEFRMSNQIIIDIENLTGEIVGKLIHDIMKIQGIDKCDVIITYKEDEMYINEKLECKYNAETKQNEVWGTCNNHRNDSHVRIIVDQADADTVMRQLNDKDSGWHLCSMINLIQVGIQSIHGEKNGNFIIAALPHCNFKNHKYTKLWMKCLANVKIDDQILVSTNSTDGCSEWRLCKQQLMSESTTKVNVGLHMVPQRVIEGENGFLLSGSDQRHNFKGDWAKISKPKGVKIVDEVLKLDFVQKCGILVSIWEAMSNQQIINDKNDWIALICSYAKDEMNVPNPLRFYKCLGVIKIDNNLNILKQALPSHHEKLNEMAIYSHIMSAYIATLMDRSATWYERLVNFSLSANGIWILFNKNGTKFCSSQLFYEKQSTAKMFYQLVHHLLNNDNFEELIDKFVVYIQFFQSQPCEDQFLMIRSMNNGPMTTISAISSFKKASIISTILNHKPDWKAKNYRLDGLERINMKTLIGNNKLIDDDGNKCDLKRAYGNGITILINLFKKHKPDYYNNNKELFDFKTAGCNWLKTQTRDYECKAFKDDDFDEKYENVRRIEDEMKQAEVYDEIGFQIRAHVGLPDIETMRFPQNDIHSKISVKADDGSTMTMTVQRYFNMKFNCPRYDGNSNQKRSSDRLKAIKGINKLKKRDLNNIVLNDNNDTSNVEELCVFTGVDFMTVRIKTEAEKSLYFIATPCEFSLITNGQKKYYNKLNQIQLQNDKINMCLIPLKLAKIDRHGNKNKLKELMVDKNNYQYVLNQIKMNNGSYIIRDVSVVNGVRTNHKIFDQKLFFKIKDLKSCIVALKQLNPPNESFKLSNKIIAYNLTNILSEKDKSMTSNIKTKSNIKNKRMPKNQNKKSNDEKKEEIISFIKSKTDTAPCTICMKVIPAFELYFHHSLHFSKEILTKNDKGEIIDTKYEMKNTIIPNYKYDTDENDQLIFVEIPEEQRTPLSANACLFCCSSQSHSHILKPGTSNPKPHSDCYLFYKYSYGNAVRSSTSSPTTNVPVQCFRCKTPVDKYLMPKHLQDNCGEYAGLIPEQYIVKADESKSCYKKLIQVQKTKDKITSKWNVIVELPKQNIINQSQKKASEQFSIKANNGRGKKRTFSNMNSPNNRNNPNKNRRLQ
eukprot:213981_1